MIPPSEGEMPCRPKPVGLFLTSLCCAACWGQGYWSPVISLCWRLSLRPPSRGRSDGSSIRICKCKGEEKKSIQESALESKKVHENQTERGDKSPRVQFHFQNKAESTSTDGQTLDLSVTKVPIHGQN